MTTRTLALALLLLGLLLLIVGWLATHPVGFVGPALLLLGGVLIGTRGRHGR